MNHKASREPRVCDGRVSSHQYSRGIFFSPPLLFFFYFHLTSTFSVSVCSGSDMETFTVIWISFTSVTLPPPSLSPSSQRLERERDGLGMRNECDRTASIACAQNTIADAPNSFALSPIFFGWAGNSLEARVFFEKKCAEGGCVVCTDICVLECAFAR